MTLDQLYGIQLSWASHNLSVIRSGASLAGQLGISVGDPVLYNEHLMYDQNDRKTHLSKSWFRSDRFRLKTVVRRGMDESFYSAMAHEQASETEQKSPRKKDIPPKGRPPESLPNLEESADPRTNQGPCPGKHLGRSCSLPPAGCW